MAEKKAVLQNGGKSPTEFLTEFFGCGVSEPQGEPAEVIELEIENDPK
jgi:hypothetical protein